MFLAAIYLLLSPAAGWAQSEAPQVVTLEDAVRIAQRQNTQLQQSANQAAMQAARLREERLGLLPSLQLSSGGGQSYGLTFDQTAGRLVQRQTHSFSAGASAYLTLFDGFRSLSALQQADAQRDATESRHARLSETITYEVLQSFLQVVLNKRYVEIRRESVEAEKEQLQLVAAQIEAGVKPPADSLQQAERIAGSEVQLLEAERNLEVSKTELVRTLGLEPFGAYRFEAPAPEAPALPANLQTLYQEATANRSDLQAQRQQIRAAREDIDIQKSARWPSVSLSGRTSSSYTSANDHALAEQLAQNRYGSVGISVSVPLTSQLATGHRITRAEAALDNARLELEDLRREIMLQVRQAYLDYELLAERLAAAEKRLTAAETALEAETERYALGLSSVPDLAEVRSRYVAARAGHEQARYELAFQRRAIDYYTGQL